MTIMRMIPDESTYLFSLACLNQLSRELATPDFTPTNAQKVIIHQALCLLDLELSFKVTEYPDLEAGINQKLAFDC